MKKFKNVSAFVVASATLIALPAFYRNEFSLGAMGNVSMRDKYAPVITSLSSRGYSFIHNDHQHFIEDLPENNSKFMEGLVVDDEAAWEPEDVVMMRKKFLVISAGDSYKIAVREGVDRESLIVHSDKLTAEQSRALRALDVTFEDGYVFDPKDIVEESEAGYVVRHGDHFHFIPKEASFDKKKKASKKNGESLSADSYLRNNDLKDGENSNKEKKPTDNELDDVTYKTDDGYVFDPKDIVMEDEKGYVVRHGDHFHYIYKKDLKKKDGGDSDRNEPSEPALPSDGNKGDKGDKPSPTESDNGYDEHGKIISGDDVSRSDEVNEQGLMKGSVVLSEADLAKVKYFAEKHGIPLSKLTVKENLLIWPHSDHYHADLISTLPNPPKKEENLSTNSQGLKSGSDDLSAEDLEKVDILLQEIGLKRENTFVKDGNVTITDPNKDRKWEYKLSEIILSKDFPDTEEVNEQGLKLGSDKVSEDELTAIRKYANSYGLDLSDIYVKNAVVHRQKFDEIFSEPLSSIVEAYKEKGSGTDTSGETSTVPETSKEGSEVSENSSGSDITESSAR